MNKTGFGFLRLPRMDANDEKSVNYELLNAMVDRFLELGGTYFDTAYTYLGGISEEAIRKCVVDRYPRERFVLADKLPGYQLNSYEECRVYFDESMRRCGVTYFDVYLLHWLNDKNYAIAEAYDQFRFLWECKASGMAKKIGFSYHDGPELLDKILTEHPEVDYVQLQINYLDWNSVSLQAGKCYEVAVKHGKQVIVMEPVKGGSLAKLPEDAAAVLKEMQPQNSIASWAIRFAGSLEQVKIVLSGMNTMEQIEDNMRSYSVLIQQEQNALQQAAESIRSATAIPCTGCAYCTGHCPVGMPIPQYFALYNDYARTPGEDWKMRHAYDALANQKADASECIGCGNCEANCPQKIKIMDFLKKVAASFNE